MDFADEVRQAVLGQIALDQEAARTYQGIAAWADAMSFHGLKRWAKRSAKAHLHQAHEFIEYGEDRTLIQYAALPAPASSFADYLGALGAAQAIELRVIANMQRMSDVARANLDESTAHVAGHYLHRFETEQASVIEDALLVVERIAEGDIDEADAEVIWR